nr:hypothetical protein [Tanacetum cinerariifolium]
MEFALMAKSKNEVYDDSHCSKSCRKNTETLNTKINKLNKEVSDCETLLYHYKRGLSQVEARLVKFKEQEIKLCERIRGLERDVENLLGSQILDKNKEGLGYNAVPPPPAQVYSPPKKDMSWTGLPEFVDDTVTNYSRPTPSIDTSNSVTSDLQSNNSSVSELGESSGSIMSKTMIKFVKAADCLGVIKNNKTKTARKSLVRYAEIQVNTARPKAVINAVRTSWFNDVKASACWVWKPIKPNSASIILKRYDYVYVRGRSRSGPISFNTARQSHLNVVCCCCSRQVNTARPKAVINAVRTSWFNDVKASACWVWKPIKPNSASIILKRYDYVYVRGRS